MPQNVRRSAVRSRGFTLTEFAVVFVILIAAALMLMPIYARFRQAARKATLTTCLSNEKQMAIAMLMYVQDYDEHFPLAGGIDASSGSPQTVSWGVGKMKSGVQNGLIFPYVKNAKIFHCPDGPTGGLLTYRYNDLLADARTLDCTSKSQTVMLMDGEELSFNVGHGRAAAGTKTIIGATINAQGRVDAGKGALVLDAATRHGGAARRLGANYAFVDGHVKWHAPDRIFFPDQASASRWSRDAKTKTATGPTPGGAMTFTGKTYAGTFHVR